jgi:predicted transcriptional regulator
MKTMVSTRIEDEVKQELENIADEEDRSVSYIIRRIIVEWLQKNRNFKPPKSKRR